MQVPTGADVQEWSRSELIADLTVAQADRTVKRAVAAFKRYTGLRPEDVDPDADEVPDIEKAIQGLAEMTAAQESEDYLDTLSDWDLISSFSATGYSENHRSADEAMKARLLVAWPWLSALLWDLMTDDKRDHYDELFGGSTPAWGVQEVDWGASRTPYVDSAADAARNPTIFGA